MHLRGFMAAGWILASAAVAASESFETGRGIEEVKCLRVPACSYMLYLPSGYAAEREVNWPILFLMGPEGAAEEAIRRYISGAELNQWIVVMSVQAKDGFEHSKPAVAAMVNDAV